MMKNLLYPLGFLLLLMLSCDRQETNLQEEHLVRLGLSAENLGIASRSTEDVSITEETTFRMIARYVRTATNVDEFYQGTYKYVASMNDFSLMPWQVDAVGTAIGSISESKYSLKLSQQHFDADYALASPAREMTDRYFPVTITDNDFYVCPPTRGRVYGYKVYFDETTILRPLLSRIKVTIKKKDTQKTLELLAFDDLGNNLLIKNAAQKANYYPTEGRMELTSTNNEILYKLLPNDADNSYTIGENGNEQYLFAGDYTDSGLGALIFSFKLELGGAQWPLEIPVSKKLEQGSFYHFILNWESDVITLYMTIQKDWTEESIEENIEDNESFLRLGQWSMESGWENGNGENGEEDIIG